MPIDITRGMLDILHAAHDHEYAKVEKPDDLVLAQRLVEIGYLEKAYIVVHATFFTLMPRGLKFLRDRGEA